MSDETIFDKILAKKLPANIVYEDDDVLAFRDVNPQAPTHVLVIPKKKVRSFTDLQERPAEEVGAFFKGVSKVAKNLELSEGYRIILNCGKHGQQTVDYIHAHILGSRQLSWPPG